MQCWIDVLNAIGCDKTALAVCLRAHRPVVEGWVCITAPIIVAAGVDDAGAAPASGSLPGGLRQRSRSVAAGPTLLLGRWTCQQLVVDDLGPNADPAVSWSPRVTECGYNEVT